MMNSVYVRASVCLNFLSQDMGRTLGVFVVPWPDFGYNGISPSPPNAIDPILGKCCKRMCHSWLGRIE